MKRQRPEDIRSIARIEEIIAKISEEWKAEPNILDIVPALRTKAGKVYENKFVIGFHVAEKVAPEFLTDRGYRPIPAEIEGIPTDVILARRPTLGSVDCVDTRSALFDTLIGGIAVGNSERDRYGTLGMTLLAESDGRVVGLTNEHVLVYDGDGQEGDDVEQPRFNLQSEVSLDSASCCPNGQLHYRGVDNPWIDAAAGVFAAAAFAAALSDEIDPHRRGQAATTPGSNERTSNEVVSVALDYPEIPFLGRPYKIKTKWKYQRHTDTRVMEHAVSETRQNEHVLAFQHLITNKHSYTRGEAVTFLAVLGFNDAQPVCRNYFVTAACLSQSHQRSHKIILRPFDFRGGTNLTTAPTHGSPSHQVEGDLVRRCYGFSGQEPAAHFQKLQMINGLEYDPRGYTAEFVEARRGTSVALRFPDRGLVVKFRVPVQSVKAQVAPGTDGKVTMTAYRGKKSVGSDKAEKSGSCTLEVKASSIDHIIFRGGSSEAVLSNVCTEINTGHACFYMGKLMLRPDEEAGQWTTYLFAQNRNDVAVDEKPEVAAQTIGGWPMTDNFASLGEYESLAYGHQCVIGIVPDGDFEVVS